MVKEYVDIARAILKKKSDEEIEAIVREIEDIAERAEKLLQKIEDTGEEELKELLEVEPRLRKNISKLLELSLSDLALELAKHLAVINGRIVKDVAKEVYSKKFQNYSELIDELADAGIISEDDFSIAISPIVKDVLEDFESEEHHKLAVEYYEKITKSLENLAELTYHCVKAGYTDKAIELFIDTANQIYGRHPCVSRLIEAGEKLLKFVEDDDTKCRILGTLGNLHLATKKYDEAEACYKAVLNYYLKKSKDDESYAKFVAGVLNNLGNLYYSKGEYKKAEDAYKECLKIRLEMEDEDGTALVLLTLADLYLSKDRYEDAEKCFHDALRIELKRSKTDKERLINVASIINNLGYLYKRMGDLDKAERFYKEAVRIYGDLAKERKEMLRNLITALNNLSSLYMSKGKVDDAMDILEEIKEHWDVIPPDLKATFYMLSARGLENKGDSKAAEFYFKAGALGFIVFRNFGVTPINFMHCLDKAEQLGEGSLKGDAKIIKAAIMKKYYGVKSEFPQVDTYSSRGEAILKALKGEKVDVSVEDEIDMATFILANELFSQKR
jgi:tetratricopeptide (TPR) repeat protein